MGKSFEGRSTSKKRVRRLCKLSLAIRRFSKVIEDLELRDLPLQARMKVSIFFTEILGFGGRRYERGGRNVDGRNFAKFWLELVKNGYRRKIGEIFKKLSGIAIYRRIFGLHRRFFYRFFGKFPYISYQSILRTGYKICSIFYKKKNIKMLFGNLIMICRQRLCFLA